MDRRQAEEIGLDCNRIPAAHRGKGRVWKSRIEVISVFGYASMQRANEIIVAPVSNSGFAIRRDVRRIDGPEGKLERQAPGKRSTPRCIVTGRAIRGARQILAVRD